MELIERIRASRLAPYGAILELLMKPTILLRPTAQIEHPVGASKIGGKPDLPPEWDWPEWQGRPLAFLAQFRMEEFASVDIENLLPHSGMLYFFYEAEEQPWGIDREDFGSWRVLYYDSSLNSLRRRLPPQTLPEECQFEEILVSPELFYTLPFELDELEQLAPEIQLGEELCDEYREIVYETPPLDTVAAWHWMLGYHAAIQDASNASVLQVFRGMDWEEAYKQASEMILLLQLDTDDRTGMMWGDAGRLYFWIHRDDLAARRFDEVLMELQCY